MPSSLYDPDYIYSSWIRNATVFVARANLHMESDEPAQARGGFVLSAARNVMVEHPAMRPDLTEDQVPTDEISARDAALNSLCEFDIAYCFIVAAMGSGHGSAYPSSSAFDEDRSKPMAQRIVADANLREQMFPGFPTPTSPRRLPKSTSLPSASQHLTTAVGGGLCRQALMPGLARTALL